MADIKVYQSRFTKAISSYEDSRAGVQTSRQQNLSRRTCYSILQFLKIDLETVIDTGDIDEKQAKELCGEIQQYCEESLPLQQIREPISTLYLMGEAIRIFAAWMNLVNFALVLSLPVVSSNFY
jgi:hypothetical protein